MKHLSRIHPYIIDWIVNIKILYMKLYAQYETLLHYLSNNIQN